MFRNGVLSSLFWTCILHIYIHPPVVMASKVQQVATGSKGVKKKHVTLTFTKKLEVLKMFLIFQTIKSLLYYIIFWTIHINLRDNSLGGDSVISSFYA
jgi:hypothetical protein